ncbi:unnamed protein product [Dracunculus medinensis]|uniref:Uncharacterized protein n=1 Tax=Dracunculus medinensis TaxID=318479 RepID=A0A0N4UPQ1_DRAME|nr:unnamed protein product [Dracunculus medinensis]
MIRNINGAPVKTIKNRFIRRKEFFDAKPNHDAPSVIPDITHSLVEPYVCNCELPAEKKKISIIHKANKTPGEDGLRAL